MKAQGHSRRDVPRLVTVLAAVAVVFGTLGAPGRAADTNNSAPRLVLVRQHPTPVITTRTPGAEGNRYGFEGGRAVKVGGTYHLFTTEMVGDPMWVKTRFGHWTSGDRLAWTRIATVRESSGEFEGKDPRASLWSPLPVWDPGEKRWNLFYVAYRSMPTDGTRFLLNHAGEIWRAVSRTEGPEGIRGPFEDVGVVMRPGTDSLPWEGLQGTDSFFPWPVGRRWRALYGSARTETKPISHWLVGPAEAPSLAGPWRRVAEDNPVPIEARFIENPIVTEARGGGWLAVYDGETPDGIGWAWSDDGVRWGKGQGLVLQPKAGEWSKEVRTPLGLVPEGGDRFTVFYTGFEQAPDWTSILETGTSSVTCAVGFVELRLER
jgi:hypothetical protein